VSNKLKRLFGGVAFLGLGGVLIFACSSSNSSDVSATQACADVASARCQKLQQCNPQSLLNIYGDLGTCTSTQASTCVSNLAAIDTANTPAHTEGCAQATPSQTCDDFALGNVPAPCTPPAGPRDAGSDCAVSGQCATANCLVPKTSVCGTCAAPPGLGDDCFNNSCGPGLLCNKVSFVCVAPVAAAAACDDSSECAPGLTCIGNTSTVLGACVALAALGASCNIADGGSRCDGRIGLYCNTEAGKVCAPVATASSSQQCGTVDGGVIDCLSDSFCEKAMGSTAGTCVPPAAAGLPCDTVNGPNCTLPSRCVLGVAGGTSGTCQTTNPQSCN
jgi:hypothetical protein